MEGGSLGGGGWGGALFISLFLLFKEKEGVADTPPPLPPATFNARGGLGNGDGAAMATRVV